MNLKTNVKTRTKKNHRRRGLLRLEALEGRQLLSGSSWQNPVVAYDVDERWEALEGRPVLVGCSCQNPVVAYDVDDNGLVEPSDVQIGYNALNLNGPQTPAPEFEFLEMPPPFYDVSGDGDHTPLDLVQGVNYLNMFGSGPYTGMSGGGPYTGTVEVRLDATDLSGNPITSIELGDSFLMRAYVKDRGVAPQGVFAAYTNVNYDAALATVSGSITSGQLYSNVLSGALSGLNNIWLGPELPEGLLLLAAEAGGVSGSLGPLGGGEFLLFEVPLVANAVGQITFTSNPASGLGHEVLVYGSDSPVPSGQIDYGSVSLDIVGLDLLASSDSNVDNDNVTNITDMSFRVADVSDGGLVQVLANGIVIGQATATGNSVVIHTNALAAMRDGTYDLTTVQTLDGVSSVLPHTLRVTLDTTAPVALTSVPPSSATIGVPFDYNAEHPEEGTAGFRYSLIAAPDDALNPPVASVDASIDPVTGQFSWTPISQEAGNKTFQIQASDLAGNTVSQPMLIDVTAVGQLAQIRLEATDLDGNPITTIDPGQDFLLSAYVKDLRDSGQGVFAAYLDVLYNPGLVSAVDQTVGDISFSDSYQNGKSGSLATPGLIDEVGAFSGFINPLTDAERLLFTVQLSAAAAGTVEFTGRNADDMGHDVLLYGIDPPVAANAVTYVPATLTIGAEPGGELIALNDTFNVNEDSAAVTLDVLANDTRTPGESITITSVGAPSAGGTVTISADGQRLIYSPATNFAGEESFQYTIRNGNLTSSATVSVTVPATNDTPTAADDEFTVDRDSVSNGLHVLDNDTTGPDLGEILRVMSVGLADKGGTITIAPNGTHVLYTPAPSFTGIETFTYYITDGNGGVATAIATVTVTPRINFVDANNNGHFDAGMDVPLIHGELEDGSFSTTKREGGYTTVIVGAGLVIKVGVVGSKDLDFRADGRLVVEATLDAGRDIQLHGSAIALTGVVTAARNITLKADGPITAVGAALQAGRDVSLTVNGVVDSASIVLDGAAVTAGRNVAVVAKRGSVSIVGATVTAAKKAEITARDQIFADWASVAAGEEIDLTADDILGSGIWNAPKIKIKTT